MLTILDEVNKLLGYLNINTKYLNRAYTLLSTIPMFLLIKSLVKMIQHNITPTLIGYSIITFLLLYFWILNFLYYFLNKNTKLDITQLLARKLPDEMFNRDGTVSNSTTESIVTPDTEIIPIAYSKHYEIKLRKNIDKLIKDKNITINDYQSNGGYLIPKNTLHPYYYLTKNNNEYIVMIGTDWNNMEEIGRIYTGGRDITTLGLYIIGGPFSSNNVIYNRAYDLQLLIKKQMTRRNLH